MSTPLPGDYGVLLDKYRNPFKNLAAAIVCWGSRSEAYHAVICLGADGDSIIQAEPGGVRVADITGNVGRYAWSSFDLTDRQRQRICGTAYGYIGTPYNWLDDIALGLSRRFGWRLPKFILRRVQSDEHLQCAQLVDAAYRAAGVQLFDDGRVPGAVTPGDLYDLICPQGR